MGKKFLIAVSCALIVLLIISACTYEAPPVPEDPFARYSAQTSHITIYSGYNGELATKEVSTEKELTKLIKAIDFSSTEWQLTDQTPSGQYYYYLDLNNGTVIALYAEEAAGAVGTAFTSTMNIENSSLLCQMPNGLLKAVQELTK